MIILWKVCGLNFNDLELYAVVNVLSAIFQSMCQGRIVLSRSALAGATTSWVPGTIMAAPSWGRQRYIRSFVLRHWYSTQFVSG